MISSELNNPNQNEIQDNSFDSYIIEGDNCIKFNRLTKNDQYEIQEFFNGIDLSIESINELINEMCYISQSKDQDCELTVNYLEGIIRDLKRK